MLFFLKNDTITEILNLKNYFYFPLRGVSLIYSEKIKELIWCEGFVLLELTFKKALPIINKRMNKLLKLYI